MRYGHEGYTLNDIIIGKYIPSEQDIASFIRFISQYARSTTKQRLSRFRYIHFKMLKPLGIYERLRFYGNGVIDYTSGQDGRAEIKTIREEILKRTGL